MKGALLFVLLLVATGVAQTDKTPDKKTGTESPTAAAKKHVKTEAVKVQKAAPAKTKAGPEEEPQAQTDQDPKLTSVPGSKALGMSILGNQEAPTSLVIVP